MGCLGAYFCGDFDEISEVIGHRLYVSGRSSWRPPKTWWF
jgi:hypothetical protein